MIFIQLIHISTIATSLVILGGVAIVLPDFIRVQEPTRLLLTFDIIYDIKLPDWCNDLSDLLEYENVHAAVFISGKIAQKYPNCLNSFKDGIDIGSQTYNYVNLNSISDYSQKLLEIKNGKEAVDSAGNLDSKLFRAPFGNTDDNIYSLLHRSNILADFSYDSQYNKFQNGKFIKYEISKYNYSEITNEIINYTEQTDEPILLNFDNTIEISNIKEIISEIKLHPIKFVSASELVETKLTIRHGDVS